MKLTRVYLALVFLLLLAHSLVISPSPSLLSPSLVSSLSFNTTDTAHEELVYARPAAQNNRTAQHNRSHHVVVSSASDPVRVPVTRRWNPDDVATDGEWARLVQKGSMLRCLMESTDEEAGGTWDPWNRQPYTASSPWRGTLVDELATWFWKEGDDDQTFCYFGNDDPHNDAHHKIADALTSLGISILPRSHGGDNTCYSINHFDEDSMWNPEDQIYTVGEKLYTATGAYYRFGLNPVAGAIFAQNLVNPMTAAIDEWTETPTVDDMPALRLASDIIFAYWLRNAPNPRVLQYYFVNHIVNVKTAAVITRVLRDSGRTAVPRWPGLSVDGSTEAAAALIGSPLGATLAYMLIQHKAELGIKAVTEIVIFREDSDDEFPELQLLFKIAEVQHPNGEPDVGMARQDSVVDGGLQVRYAKEMGGGYADGVRTHVLAW
ncbi:hypothetical protein NX059_009621 [Plenodomus lindquistii]|nr:hypothetical protein NX059_009621 [Plenodomus lindquistii]